MGWQPQNTLAASYQTCKLALLVHFGSYQMKKMKKKDHPVILEDVDPVKLIQQSRIAQQHWVFAMAPKSRHGEPTPQPSLWPLSLVLSKPGKASAGLRSKQGWLHEWISHSPKTVVALTFPHEDVCSKQNRKPNTETQTNKIKQHFGLYSLTSAMRWHLGGAHCDGGWTLHRTGRKLLYAKRFATGWRP